MPQRLAIPAAVGSLLKRPREARQRRHDDATRDAAHLAAVRQLPCLKCGMEPAGQAAHVRLNSAAFGKRQAIGRKPSDSWALSLCTGCHREQHAIGELQFWHSLGLNPLLICRALYAVSPNIVRMRAVVFSFMAGR